MKIIGIDLSGPANHHDTIVTIFRRKEKHLFFEDAIVHASDEMIMSKIIEIASSEEVMNGIDAPLSYQAGGGDRPQDKSLRQCMKNFGLSPSSVMPPTF